MKTSVDLGFLTQDEFASRRSKTLIDPNVELVERVEIDSYISSLDIQYAKEIETLSCVTHNPFSEKVRVIVTIVAYNEGARIRSTLNNYVKQDLDPSLFEIIVFDNHPEDKTRDNTVTEVESFKSSNPRVSVIYAHKTWRGGEYATVGNARKHVFDIAIARINSRGKSEKDTVLISNDADTESLDENYLSSILKEFETNEMVDALVTLSVVPSKVILKPNIYAALSLWDALDETVAEGEPYNLIGRSSAYRTSIYAAVGGYNPRGKLAGDLETGVLISDARAWNPNRIIQFKKTRHVQDPRRILEAVANRVPINEMYFKFVSNPEIRDANNDVLLSMITDQLDWELFEEDADSFWQGRNTGMYKWREDKFESDFKKSMDKIGVQYELLNDRVKLKNLSGLIAKYKSDFSLNVSMCHSIPRAWDQARQDEMTVFFSSVSDSIIASRKKWGINR